jgi:GntR family transcriptional regulator
LEEQIRYFLLSGSLQPGTQVPTPKDLGTYLRINRNTVISAYKELEKEGLLVTKHGQGTYISDKLPTPPDMEKRQALISLVNETLNKTHELGFSPEDLFTLVFNQAVLGLDSINDFELRALVVECNKPDLDYFYSTLKAELGIHIDGCLLSELEDRIDDDAVTRADFVITSVIHLEEVKAILESLNKDVLAIYATPHLQTFMRIAQLPAGTKVGVACGTERGACNMKNALVEAGINNIDLEYCATDNKTKVKEVVNRVDWVIASRMAYEELKAVAPPNVRFMEFFSELDKPGIEMLKQYISKRREQK